MKIKFSDCVEYMIKGPFGSDMKKSLYVPKGDDTYKVYIQGNAIQKDETLGDYYVSSEYFHQKLERFEVHPGDYIITCDGTLGKHLKLSEDIEKGVISSSLLLLKLNDEKIYDKYFELLWDNSMLAYLASQARNACLVHLPSAKAIGDVVIELPELSVQKDIADRAFLIKDVMDQRNTELDLLDDLIKARFVELFGDRFINDKCWPTRKLGECISFNNGKAHEQVVDEDGEYVLVTSRAIASDFSDVRRTNALLFPLHKNDIVMVMSDVPNGKALAKCQLINEDNKYTLNQRICSFDKYDFNPVFLLHLLNRHQYFLAFNDGNGQTNLRKNDILECELIEPPKVLQIQFADFVKQVDKSRFIYVLEDYL